MQNASVRKRFGTLLLAVTVLAGVAGACRDAAPVNAAAKTTTEGTPVWRQLGTWSGAGDRQTDSFDVATGALQLRWEARETTPGAGRLTVSLHSAISGRPLQTVLDVRGGGAAHVYVADEPRVSYLVVESAGVDWRLELLEQVSGEPRQP